MNSCSHKREIEELRRLQEWHQWQHIQSTISKTPNTFFIEETHQSINFPTHLRILSYQEQQQNNKPTVHINRREIILRSSKLGALRAIFHFRNYNPEGGRGSKKPVSREEAMQELLDVFVDDVEFWFPPGKKPIVEYRCASRLGNFDFDVNRKRIKALRQELEKKGWASEDTI